MVVVGRRVGEVGRKEVVGGVGWGWVRVVGGVGGAGEEGGSGVWVGEGWFCGGVG